MTPLEEKLAAAAYYCKRRFMLFPVDQDKKPYLAWSKLATSDLTIVERWLTHWPGADALLAIALPHELVVVDIDVKHCDGFASFVALAGVHPDDLDTWQMTTGSGGRHVWFATKGHPFTNTVSKIGKGLDTRTIGGMVVVAPAPGRTWIKQRNLMPAPQWLCDALPPQTFDETTERVIASEDAPEAVHLLLTLCRKIREAPPGTRNKTLNNNAFVIGGYVAGGWLDRARAEQHLLDAYHASEHVAGHERWVKEAFTKGMLQPIQHLDTEADYDIAAAGLARAERFFSNFDMIRKAIDRDDRTT